MIRIVTIGLAFVSFCFSAAKVSAYPEHVTLETKSAKDFFTYVDRGTLVIFEVEDVLLRPKEHLGTEQWADAQVRHLCLQGYTPNVARAEITPLWNRILPRLTMQEIDPLVQGALRTFQRQGCLCMGLTLKDSDVSPALLQHLRDVDVDFSASCPRKGIFLVASDAPAKLIDGVFFSGVYNQPGITLVRFLDQLGLTPGKVVMISAKIDTLQAVGGAVAARGIPFLGIRYAGGDEAAAEYRSDLAEVQLNFFDRVLSNEAADVIRPRSSFWPF